MKARKRCEFWEYEADAKKLPIPLYFRVTFPAMSYQSVKQTKLKIMGEY